jgi:hypothetical protein
VPPPPPGEDPAATAGAMSPPLAWQDVDLQRGCVGDASVNADAVDDDCYNDDGGDSNDGDGGHDLVFALAQPHPHPCDGEDNRDASPPSRRLAAAAWAGAAAVAVSAAVVAEAAAVEVGEAGEVEKWRRRQQRHQ